MICGTFFFTSSQFPPEGEVTVLAKETVASSNRSHCSETETGAGVLRGKPIEIFHTRSDIEPIENPHYIYRNIEEV